MSKGNEFAFTRQSETEGQYHLEETPKDRSGATKLAVTDEDVAGTNL